MKANPDRKIYFPRNIGYPKQIWWFLACLIFIVGACQLISRIHGLWSLSRRRQARKKSPADVESYTGSANGPSSSLYRLLLALINAYRVIAFRTTLTVGPFSISLAEMFLTCAYIIAIFTWLFINTTNLAGEKLAVRYWQDRAGVVAASQVPLVTVLGLKHNAIGWITGVGYDKLNLLHRAAARTLMVVVWVHAGSHIHYGVEESLSQTYLRWGIVSVGSLSLLFLFSLRPVRQQAYELFFYLHFICALLMILGAYFHTARFHLDTWVWPSFVL